MRIFAGMSLWLNIWADSPLKWLIPGIAGAVVLLLLVWLIAARVAHRRHDRELEEEVRREISPPKPVSLNAEVTVIPKEELPGEGANIFMPVPGTVSDLVDFVEERRDGVGIRSCIRAEDADRMMTDEQAGNLLFVLFRKQSEGDACAYLSLDTLSDTFAPYSYVNLTILKQNGLVGEQISSLVIQARGVLRKPLMIEANEFSLTAVKMISLTGGRAIQVKPQS